MDRKRTPVPRRPGRCQPTRRQRYYYRRYYCHYRCYCIERDTLAVSRTAIPRLMAVLLLVAAFDTMYLPVSCCEANLFLPLVLGFFLQPGGHRTFRRALDVRNHGLVCVILI